MRKQYQNKEIDTTRAVVPEQVSVALGEPAGGMANLGPRPPNAGSGPSGDVEVCLFSGGGWSC